MTYLRTPVSSSIPPSLPRPAQLISPSRPSSSSSSSSSSFKSDIDTARYDTLVQLRDEAKYLGLEELEKLCIDELELAKRIRRASRRARKEAQMQNMTRHAREESNGSIGTASHASNEDTLSSSSTPRVLSSSTSAPMYVPGPNVLSMQLAASLPTPRTSNDERVVHFAAGSTSKTTSAVEFGSRSSLTASSSYPSRAPSHSHSQSLSVPSRTHHNHNLNAVLPPPSDILKERLRLRARSSSRERGLTASFGEPSDNTPAANQGSTQWHTMKNLSRARPVGDWI